jgi:hypothetical protein
MSSVHGSIAFTACLLGLAFAGNAFAQEAPASPTTTPPPSSAGSASTQQAPASATTAPPPSSAGSASVQSTVAVTSSSFYAGGAGEARPTPPATPPSPGDGSWSKLGGHIGLALPIAHLGGAHSTHMGASHNRDSFFTLSPVFGITVKLTEKLAFDFENVVGINLNRGTSRGTSMSYTVDPGVIYDFGPVAVGGRLGFTVTDAQANMSLIPLVNKTFKLGDRIKFFGDNFAVFVEADFPVLFEGGFVTLTPVAHAGFAF